MVMTGMGDSSDYDLSVTLGADANDFNDAIDGATDRLLTLRKVAGIASAAIAALGAYGFYKATRAAANFEEQMVEVEKVTNPETAREMGSAIQDMANEIPLAHEELATIAADAGRFGLEGSKSIEQFTETVSKMSVATELSAEESGEALARLAELTDTPTDKIENLGSVINTLSNNAATDSDEIVDAMLRSSASLSQLGLEQDQIAALNTALNEVSESSQRAGTRLRRVGQQLMDPKVVSALSEALGMSAEKFRAMRDESPLKLIVQLAQAMREGGDAADALRQSLATPTRQALAGLAQNLDGVTESLAMSQSEMEDATSLQREFEAAQDTFNARLQKTQNQLTNVAITTGNSTLPVLTDLLGTTNMLLNGFNDLNKATNGLAGQLALLGAVAGGTGAALSLLGVMAGGPVAAAIFAVGALGIAYSHNLAGIRDAVDRTSESITEMANDTWNALNDSEEQLNRQMSAWQQFEAGLAQVIDTLVTGIMWLIDAIVTMGNVGQQSFNALMKSGNVVDKVLRGDMSAEEGVKQINENIKGVEETWNSAEERMNERLDDFWDRTQQRSTAVSQGRPDLLPKNLDQPHRGRPRWKSAQQQSQNFQDRYGEMLEKMQKRRKKWQDELSGLMGDNVGANKEIADKIKNSPLADTQSLKEGLLDPFERAQPSCPENASQLRAENQINSFGDLPRKIQEQIQTGRGTEDLSKPEARVSDGPDDKRTISEGVPEDLAIKVDGEMFAQITRDQLRKHERDIMVTE